MGVRSLFILIFAVNTTIAAISASAGKAALDEGTCCENTSPKTNNCGPVPPGVGEFKTNSAASCEVNASEKSYGLDLLPGVKSEKELMRFFSCYRGPLQFCNFKNNLLPYMKLASKSSGVPFAMLACMVAKESSFKDNQISNLGQVDKPHAQGYSQMTWIGWEDVRLSLFSDQTQKPSANQMLKLENTLEQLKLKQASETEGSEEWSLQQAKIDQLVAKIDSIKIYDQVAIDSWNQYWSGTDPKLMPKSCSYKQAHCPQFSFIMQATKLSYDAKRWISKNSTAQLGDPSFQIGSLNHFDSLVMTVGGYIGGMGTFAKKCAHKTLQQCKNMFNVNSDTHQYMAKIDKCMKSGDYDSMWKETSTRDCSGQECEQ